MNVKILLLFLLLAAAYQTAWAQTENASDSAKALAEEVRVGNYQSILDAGKSGDKTLVPYLKTLALTGSPWAQMALAKLGEREYLNQILSEVDAENPDIQNRAMEKLIYVGGKRAFKKLYQLLDDKSPRGEKECRKQTEDFRKDHSSGESCGFCCDVVYGSRAATVVIFLSRAIENPPTYRSYGTDEEIAKWKEWFLVHRHLID